MAAELATLRRRLAVLLAAGLAVFVAAAPGARREAPANRPQEARVKLGAMGAQATVSGAGLAWRGRRGSGQADRAELRWDGKGLQINGRAVTPPVTFTARGSFKLDETSYPGELTVTAGRPPLLVNRVELEPYVAGVVGREVDTRWPEAALDAQAILARSYALARVAERKGEAYDLDRGVDDQVYGGLADEAARAAARRTAGKVLAYQGKLILPYYHGCCGGHTELPSLVWGRKDRPWNRSVACDYCRDAPRYFWRYPETGGLPGKDVAGSLGLAGTVSALEVLARSPTGRATSIRATTDRTAAVFTGQEFRKRLGYGRVYSAALEVERTEAGFVFRGSGAGHGVGLCQWGARGMARAGFASEQILGYYYPGLEIKGIGELRAP